MFAVYVELSRTLVWDHGQAFFSLHRRADCILTVKGLRSPDRRPRPTVSQVEAAYLYNFEKFVIWPADNAASSGFRSLYRQRSVLAVSRRHGRGREC